MYLLNSDLIYYQGVFCFRCRCTNIFERVLSRIANLYRDYKFMVDYQNIKFTLQLIKEWVSDEANNYSKMYLKLRILCSVSSVLGITFQSLKV
jgi:hypothetical protein